MYIVNKINRKHLFIFCLLLNGLFLFLFTLTTNVVVLYLVRILTGIFEVFVIIYCPVWVDQYGQSNKKTLMMSLLQVTGPVGVVSGYAMTAVFIKSKMSWKSSFQVQAGIFALLSFIVIFVPDIFFSSNLHNSKSPEEKEKTKKLENEQNNNSIINQSQENSDIVSLFEYVYVDESEASGFWKNLKLLLKQRIYMLCVAANSILLFISTIIQFWTSDYLEKVLKFEKSFILISFVLTCITAPTLGIIFGACVVQKFGGYESKNSLLICCVFAILCVMCSFPITQFNSVPGFVTFLWLFLFFGGSIVPNIIGITLSSLPNNLRAAGNSSTNFFNNLIGFIPAPFFYGIIFEKTKESSPKFAYGLSVLISFSVLILMIIANIFWRRKFQETPKVAVEQIVEIDKNNSKNRDLEKHQDFQKKNSIKNEKKLDNSNIGMEVS
jgi:MFS family permease